MMISAGADRAAISMASLPLAASATWNPADFSHLTSRRRTFSSSSTTRIRSIRATGALVSFKECRYLNLNALFLQNVGHHDAHKTQDAVPCGRNSRAHRAGRFSLLPDHHPVGLIGSGERCKTRTTASNTMLQ